MKSTKKSRDILSGDVIDNDLEFTVKELCRNCMLEIDHVVAFVQEGILEPSGNELEQWRFEIGSIRRARTAMRLQRDLGVNLAGAALALELLDRIAELESRLR